MPFDEPFEELPSPLIPEGEPITYYFTAVFEIAQGRSRTPCYRTIKIDSDTGLDFGTVMAEAQSQADAMDDVGDSCPGGVLVDLYLTGPLMYQYSSGME